MAKLSKKQRQQKLNLTEKKERRIKIYMWLIPAIAFLIKLITMSNTQYGAWLGADGENYTTALDGILKDGFASKEPKLQYWPAGYPMLLWILAKISLTYFYALVSLVQSIFFAFASYYFTETIRISPLKRSAFVSALLISFNPTLSLSSLAVGYESPIAACFMIIVALMYRHPTPSRNKGFMLAVASIGALFALSSAMQPRYMFVGIILVLIWVFRMSPRKAGAITALITFAIIAVAPAALIARNNAASGNKVISTNLGVTMRIGAGIGTSGGYAHTGPDVPCEPTPPATSPTDRELVTCVIKWYLTHPVKAVKLGVTKSFWFWSPWVGPLTNGTMARNPWLKINPVMDIIKEQAGRDLVFGGFGKLVSAMWIGLQMLSLFAGFFWLYRSSQTRLALLLATPVILSWLISLATIGDHRFRIPTMGLSLLLQIAGWYGLARKFKPLNYSE